MPSFCYPPPHPSPSPPFWPPSWGFPYCPWNSLPALATPYKPPRTPWRRGIPRTQCALQLVSQPSLSRTSGLLLQTHPPAHMLSSSFPAEACGWSEVDKNKQKQLAWRDSGSDWAAVWLPSRGIPGFGGPSGPLPARRTWSLQGKKGLISGILRVPPHSHPPAGPCKNQWEEGQVPEEHLAEAGSRVGVSLIPKGFPKRCHGALNPPLALI